MYTTTSQQNTGERLNKRPISGSNKLWRNLLNILSLVIFNSSTTKRECAARKPFGEDRKERPTTAEL